MMPLLEGAGSCSGKIVCPYHAWTYNTEGRVIGAGHMGGRDPVFDKKQFTLPELRTEIWQGWIYVTINPHAPPVSSLLSDLLPVVERYQMEGYIPVVQQDHVWNTNWKLLNENFMEGYHLPVAHKATVGAWFPVGDTEFPVEVFDNFCDDLFHRRALRQIRGLRGRHHNLIHCRGRPLPPCPRRRWRRGHAECDRSEPGAAAA